jgi:hypothetical protein
MYSGGVAKVAWERAIRNVGDARDFGHQLGLLDLIKVDQIDHIRSAAAPAAAREISHH